MTNFIIPNNASTTLAATAAPAATTLTLANATNFPTSIPMNTVLALTLNDAATRQVFEIVYVTAISGTSLTVLRGQEGTTAQTWGVGDFAYSAATAGVLRSLGYGNNQNYAADTGSANAYTVTLQPALTAHVVGFPILFKAANSNTGASTFNDGAGAAAINTAAGAALAPNSIVAGGIYAAIWNGTAFQLIAGSGRVRLAANQTYFVATTGNDTTGNGSSGAPWATIQHAVAWVLQNVDAAGFNVTISVADGTYTTGASVNGNLVGGGTLTISGDVATPANCIISTTGTDCLGVTNGAICGFQGFTVETTSSGNGISIDGGCEAFLTGAMVFGACAGDHIHNTGGGTFTFKGVTAYTISGGATAHLHGNNRSLTGTTGVAISVTVTGSPGFSQAFAVASLMDTIDVPNMTFTGSATGTRYSSADGSVIYTNGGGANYFPGSIAGTTNNQGQYL